MKSRHLDFISKNNQNRDIRAKKDKSTNHRVSKSEGKKDLMPTALELGRRGWKPYLRKGIRRPSTVPSTRAHDDERRNILNQVHEAAASIKMRLRPRRVILFGSLAHEAWFMPDSDVDLVVDGLHGQAFWEAWRLAEDIITKRPVDLIDIATVGKSMQEAIDRYGIEL
jgi:predicted nucleotidyltransferase